MYNRNFWKLFNFTKVGIIKHRDKNDNYRNSNFEKKLFKIKLYLGSDEFGGKISLRYDFNLCFVKVFFNLLFQ